MRTRCTEFELSNMPLIDASTFASTKFDYIVVGGGTAGLVVAARYETD